MNWTILLDPDPNKNEKSHPDPQRTQQLDLDPKKNRIRLQIKNWIRTRTKLKNRIRIKIKIFRIPHILKSTNWSTEIRRMNSKTNEEELTMRSMKTVQRTCIRYILCTQKSTQSLASSFILCVPITAQPVLLVHFCAGGNLANDKYDSLPHEINKTAGSWPKIMWKAGTGTTINKTAGSGPKQK